MRESLVGLKAPEIDGKVWLNSPPLKMKELKGKVVLIDFWEYTCVNCIRTLPYLKEWHKRYAKDGLVIIGVHTPEFEFGKDVENVKKGIEYHKIEYPVVLDNEYKIWDAYANHWWPRKLLVDKNGKIRYDHIGEGGYQETEKAIQELLLEINPKSKFSEPMELVRELDKPGKVCYPTTAETYVGYNRGFIGNKEGYQEGKVFDYNDLGYYDDGKIYLKGKWFASGESVRHSSLNKEDYLVLKYHAAELNAVINNDKNEDYRVYVELDGKPVPEQIKGKDILYQNGKSYLEIKEPRMYNLISSNDLGTHTLKLSSDSDRFSIYAFTFGSCEIE